MGQTGVLAVIVLAVVLLCQDAFALKACEYVLIVVVGEQVYTRGCEN
jgi:hypothetical protein